MVNSCSVLSKIPRLLTEEHANELIKLLNTLNVCVGQPDAKFVDFCAAIQTRRWLPTLIQLLVSPLRVKHLLALCDTLSAKCWCLALAVTNVVATEIT